jgi:hypothetical protein
MGTVHQDSLRCKLHNFVGHCVLQPHAQIPGAKAIHSQPQKFQCCRGEGLRPRLRTPDAWVVMPWRWGHTRELAAQPSQ